MNVRPATLAALLLAVLALFAAGCGGDDEESSATPTATATTAETEAEPAEESEEEREREEQEAADAGGKECPKDLDGEPERKPPSDVVVPAYAHVYKSEGRSARPSASTPCSTAPRRTWPRAATTPRTSSSRSPATSR